VIALPRLPSQRYLCKGCGFFASAHRDYRMEAGGARLGQILALSTQGSWVPEIGDKVLAARSRDRTLREIESCCVLDVPFLRRFGILNHQPILSQTRLANSRCSDGTPKLQPGVKLLPACCPYSEYSGSFAFKRIISKLARPSLYCI
jgi:hypothetical protein